MPLILQVAIYVLGFDLLAVATGYLWSFAKRHAPERNAEQLTDTWDSYRLQFLPLAIIALCWELIAHYGNLRGSGFAGLGVLAVSIPIHIIVAVQIARS